MQHSFVDTLFDFSGFSGCAFHCRARIFGRGAAPVVVLTEMIDNDGTSVTNAIETLAAQIADFYRLDATDLIWVEHYPDDRSPLERSVGGKDTLFEESFCAVYFDSIEQHHNGWQLRKPRWAPLSREALETLTATRWEPEFAANAKR